MGRGDKKSRKGKIRMGSFGVSRPRRKKKSVPVIVKPAPAKKPAPKIEEKPVVSIPVEETPVVQIAEPATPVTEAAAEKAKPKKAAAKKPAEKTEKDASKPKAPKAKKSTE